MADTTSNKSQARTEAGPASPAASPGKSNKVGPSSADVERRRRDGGEMCGAFHAFSLSGNARHPLASSRRYPSICARLFDEPRPILDFMPLTTLDSTDRAILEHLQRDGRIANVDLAEAVALSPSSCLRRTKALEAAG